MTAEEIVERSIAISIQEHRTVIIPSHSRTRDAELAAALAAVAEQWCEQAEIDEEGRIHDDYWGYDDDKRWTIELVRSETR